MESKAGFFRSSRRPSSTRIRGSMPPGQTQRPPPTEVGSNSQSISSIEPVFFRSKMGGLSWFVIFFIFILISFCSHSLFERIKLSNIDLDHFAFQRVSYSKCAKILRSGADSCTWYCTSFWRICENF